jgi:Zn-dependent peptidase ImmA (M78 family)
MITSSQFQDLRALARQKRAEHEVVTTAFGLRELRKIYKTEGIALDYRKLPAKIRAIYMSDDNDPSVAINKSLPPEPKLFSLAHELKHHYLDRTRIEQGTVRCGDYNENQDIEIAAEVFAAEFIYPEDEFVAFAGSLALVPLGTTAEQVVQFKHDCGVTVSYTFIRKRLERLGFIGRGAFAGIQFQKLEEEIYGLPIYKQPGFQARRAARRRLVA